MQQIYVNLPVRDVARAAAFYEAIGFAREPRFSQDGVAAAMILSDTIVFMLLSHEHFSRFAVRPITDATQGRIDPSPADDYGYMYGRSFEDLDGHLVAPMWMDQAGFDAAQAQQAAPVTG